jgi:hypothetical protein
MTVLNDTILNNPIVVKPTNVTLDQHLSEIMEAQRMLEDDGAEVGNYSNIARIRPVVTKKASSKAVIVTTDQAKPFDPQVARNEALKSPTAKDLRKVDLKDDYMPISPCPICSGQYLTDGQILDLGKVNSIADFHISS